MTTDPKKCNETFLGLIREGFLFENPDLCFFPGLQNSGFLSQSFHIRQQKTMCNDRLILPKQNGIIRFGQF